MKVSPAQLRNQIADKNGFITPLWSRWLNELADSLLREVKDTSATPTAPMMKTGETVIFKCTGISKTYLVYYDGIIRYYWEATGTDLY